MSARRSLILVGAVLTLLAACSSAPRKPAPAAAAPVAPAGKGGGYYQNDGPPSEVGVDLAALPDAEPRAEPPHRYANR